MCSLNLEEHSIYSFKSADFLTYILKQRHNLTHQQHSCLVLTDVDAAREAEKDLFALMQPVTRDVSTNFRPREKMWHMYPQLECIGWMHTGESAVKMLYLLGEEEAALWM